MADRDRIEPMPAEQGTLQCPFALRGEDGVPIAPAYLARGNRKAGRVQREQKVARLIRVAARIAQWSVPDQCRRTVGLVTFGASGWSESGCGRRLQRGGRQGAISIHATVVDFQGYVRIPEFL